MNDEEPSLPATDRSSLDHLRFRKPYWHPAFPAVLMWSQKAACTALGHWFFAHLGDPQRQHPDFARHGFAGLRIHEYEANVFKPRPGYLEGCSAAIEAGRPVVKLVRDPAARAFSSFVGTCRVAVLRKRSFWGARVRSSMASTRTGKSDPSLADLARPYSFVEFVDWLAETEHETLNGHVRMQWTHAETLISPELIRVEELADALATLERRFGLPALSNRPGLLESRHHRKKQDGPSGAALQQLLAEPLPVHRDGEIALAAVDSARLEGTPLGVRLRQVFARDYDAYGY